MLYSMGHDFDVLGGLDGLCYYVGDRMKRYFLIFALILLAFAPLQVRAQVVGPQLNLKGGVALTGRFVHEHPVQGFDKPMRSEGSFLISPMGPMRWTIEKPMATTTTVDEGGLTQSVGTFVLLKMTPQQMPFLADVRAQLLAALNGEWKRLEKDFIVNRKPAKTGWHITLTPRVPGSAPFQRLVATGNKFVDKVSIEMRSATDTIVFSDQALSKAGG
jgi:hypothetical protein